MVEHVPATQGVGFPALRKEKSRLCDFQVELYEEHSFIRRMNLIFSYL